MVVSFLKGARGSTGSGEVAGEAGVAHPAAAKRRTATGLKFDFTLEV
jgi:hypothetical protein